MWSWCNWSWSTNACSEMKCCVVNVMAIFVSESVGVFRWIVCVLLLDFRWSLNRLGVLKVQDSAVVSEVRLSSSVSFGQWA